MSIKLSDLANAISISLSCLFMIQAAVNVYLLRNTPKHYRVLAWYVIVCCCFDLTSWIVAELYTVNYLMLPFFNASELVLFCIFFARLLQSKVPYLLMAGGLVIGGFDLWHMLNTGEGGQEYITLGRVFTAVIIISMVFVQMFRHMERNALAKMNYGIVFYFAVTFVHFIMLNFLITVPSELKFIFWIIYALSCGFFYHLITTFLWKNRLS